jgi:hypothetical protein
MQESSVQYVQLQDVLESLKHSALPSWHGPSLGKKATIQPEK